LTTIFQKKQMMNTEYNPQEIEEQAQAFWEENQSFKADEDLAKEKFYCLSMFPYPSGALHMGHVRNYTIGDVIARYQRMQGKNVLQPMGWDAFGLPAENAAIKHKVPPAKWTDENIEAMRKQFTRLGLGYDWSRELATCKPEYYRWEQWLFTELFKKGLVYKKNAVVNWDPVDNTVLANEQVVDGRGWRSGALVLRREIPQWFFKITEYADELLADLDKLPDWPEQVRTMQKNWIGRSEGVEITFDVVGHDDQLHVYTTRPDTLIGCTYVAIAAEHPLASLATNNNPDIETFIAECRNIKVAEADMATLPKKGIDTGFKATHPITGEEVPIFIANFVLMEYGAGAVMSVPAHDERDHEFAKKYNLPIKQVLECDTDINEAAFTGKAKLIHSGEFNGMDFDTAFNAIADYLIKNNHGKRAVHYRLRDWGVSRQRYWGTPIPIINCDKCGALPVPEKDLPVVLPTDIEFTGAGSPLKSMDEFIKTTCPTCGGDAERETDTFDTFVESSWYYARFACPNQNDAMLDDRAKYWTPVDQYVGGIEHAVMHLLYARFFHKILRDEGLLNSDEPFTRLLTQGMVLKDGVKMSKSKGNTVDPNDLIKKYGADTVRLFTIFASPPEQSLEWNDDAVEGSFRFLKRIWQFAADNDFIIERNKTAKKGGAAEIDWSKASQPSLETRRQLHEILKQASFDFDRQQFNTVVSGAMKIMKLLQDIKDRQEDFNQLIIVEGMSMLLRILGPIAPHITHTLWKQLEYGDNILVANWPKVAHDALKTTQVDMIIQVNGKLRGHFSVPAEAEKTTIERAALAEPTIQKYLEGKECKKIIVVPNKLVNIVLGE